MQPDTIGPIVLRIFIFLFGLLMALASLNKLYTYFNYRYLGSSVYGIVEDNPSSGRGLGGNPLVQYTDKVGKGLFTVYRC